MSVEIDAIGSTSANFSIDGGGEEEEEGTYIDTTCHFPLFYEPPTGTGTTP